MSMAILGLGTATPTRSIAQGDAAALAARFIPPEETRALAGLYRQTRIRSRGSVLLDDPHDAPFAQSFYPPPGDGPPAGPSTRDRMARYAAEAAPLAIQAAARALLAAGLDAAEVTHLVTCSCTGFESPGVDLDLVDALGLPASVARTHVGFMGCHGAFNALRVAEAFVAARPESVALVVCVELCSLHFRYGGQADAIVSNAIFADGAAALVGGAAARAPSGGPAPWRLERTWSGILPESREAMGWSIGDHGFEMRLAASVPATIRARLPEALGAGLTAAGLSPAAVATWAVHPGGPRVLTAVEEALSLDVGALAESRGVLEEHGNMSSATILFILERLLRGATAGPCVAMAFGPGLTAEFALLERG